MQQTMVDDPGGDSFREYKRLIINELERIARDMRDLNDRIEQFRREDVAQMRTDIAILKFQAALWGSVAGLVTTGMITLAVRFIHV
jgi:hypothetical protein